MHVNHHTFTRIAAVTLLFCVAPAVTPPASAEPKESTDQRKHHVGSSFFMLGNLLPDPPSFYQLDYGYRLTPRDTIVVEGITWTYPAPLGIPYWSSSFESEDEEYPGKVRGYGVGLGYQRFHWKGLYSTFQATPFIQYFRDLDGKTIQKGFQLFLQARVGYRFEFLDHQIFLEPSVVANYWPVNTNFPDAFQEVEDDWPNYFLFEPGLLFGYRF